MPHVSPRSILEGRVAYAYVEDVAITLFDVPIWTDADVIRVMEETTSASKKIAARGSVSQFFGEIFGAAHRKLILEWLSQNGMTSQARNALLTDSHVMRGALTAYGWLTRNETKPFDPRDVDAVCTWITGGLGARPIDVRVALEGCYRAIGRPIPARAAAVAAR